MYPVNLSDKLFKADFVFPPIIETLKLQNKYSNNAMRSKIDHVF